jgi:D-lyxose ketol-isomerase
VGYVAYMRDMRTAYKILVTKPEQMRPFGRPRHRQEDNINIYLEKYDVRVWNGFRWLGIGFHGGCL